MSGSQISTVRVGAVNYLNSKPLIEGLAEAEGVELLLDFPSRLADDLAAGRLDVALVPSISCLQNPEYEVVTDACVAAHGPVLSVKLFCRVPLSLFAVGDQTLPPGRVEHPVANPPRPECWVPTGSDRATRLAGVIIAGNVVQHFCP